MDRILGTHRWGSWTGARLACKALRDFVDANTRNVELYMTWHRAINWQSPGARTGFVARFRRCSRLSIKFKRNEEDADEDADSEHEDAIQHPALLAALCVAGVSADVARSITELRLKGPLGLPTLVTVALVLAGTLRHVRILALDTDPCGMGGFGFNNMHTIHTTLRGAFSALEELILPARACLRGLEAFAGSSLHTVRVRSYSPGPLRMSYVRSLLQLPQLRQLDLNGEGWDVGWRGDDDDVWGDEEEEDDGAAGVAELPLEDASDEETFRGMRQENVREVWALRRLLVSPPPALERLRCVRVMAAEVGFEFSSITCVELQGYYQTSDLHRTAAVLLPALAATGRRLPLLKVEYLADYPVDIISLLQPHTPFARLLAATNHVELGLLELYSNVTAAEAAAAAAAVALQVVVSAVGGLPEEFVFGSCGHDAKLSLQKRPRHSGGAGGDRQAAGSAATPAAPAAVAEVTAQQVLERAAARMWDTAEAEAAATVARAEAAMAAYEADEDDSQDDSQDDSEDDSHHNLDKWYCHMNVLLRGPFVWQRTCRPGARTGAALFKIWLERLPAGVPPRAAAAASGSQAGTAAAAGAPRQWKVQRCSFATCGSGSALAVVECGDPNAALQLYRAAVAAAGKTPGCLQVSACQPRPAIDWTYAISKVTRELWDDHLGASPVPAAPMVTAATAAGPELVAAGVSEAGVELGEAVAMAAAGQGLAASEAPEAGGQEERPGRAAVGRVGASTLECDLQVLQHLLLLTEQAHKALTICK